MKLISLILGLGFFGVVVASPAYASKTKIQANHEICGLFAGDGVCLSTTDLSLFGSRNIALRIQSYLYQSKRRWIAFNTIEARIVASCNLDSQTRIDVSCVADGVRDIL